MIRPIRLTLTTLPVAPPSTTPATVPPSTIPERIAPPPATFPPVRRETCPVQPGGKPGCV